MVQCMMYDPVQDDFKMEYVKIDTLLVLQHFHQVGNVLNYEYYEDLFTRKQKLKGILEDEENTTIDNREIPKRKFSSKRNSGKRI